MKNNLRDLIEHTYALEGIDLVKVTGTDQETQINAIADDKTVIVSGTYKSPIADFIGVFGMPNLGKLKTIVGFEDYDDDAVINVVRGTRDDPNAPANIHFETKNGDFVNEYRLMGKSIVEEKIKTALFKGVNWNVEFAPTIPGILRLKKQHQANSEETTFTIKTDGTDLRVYFGDPSTHNGNFVFQSGVTGALAKAWQWPVKQFLAIMDLVGDKTVRISDSGVCEVTVDSGTASYRYLIPAQVK